MNSRNHQIVHKEHLLIIQDERLRWLVCMILLIIYPRNLNLNLLFDHLYGICPLYGD